jgi:uroporphyrinogen III methyltransferase/synthase
VVLVTRPTGRAGGSLGRLRALGAEAISAPTISIEDGDDHALSGAIADASHGRFEWVVFTSAAGVRAWWRRAERTPRARIAAVGDATAEALRDAGGEADLVPPEFTTAALGDAFPRGEGRVLLARADLATDELERILRDKGWTTERVDAYRVRPATSLPEEARAALDGGRVDAVTFTSPSTVQGFVGLAGVPNGVRVVCIGPVTADAARAAGFEVHAVADPHTEEGLIRALVGVFV